MWHFVSHAVPGAPPGSVSVSQVRSSSMRVSWSGVPCAERNGVITGYIVEYNSRSDKMMMNVSREHRSTVVTRLDPLTEYSVRVASVNSEGIGPYSEPVSMNTSKLYHTHLYCSIAAVAICHGYNFIGVGECIDNKLWSKLCVVLYDSGPIVPLEIMNYAIVCKSVFNGIQMHLKYHSIIIYSGTFL